MTAPNDRVLPRLVAGLAVIVCLGLVFTIAMRNGSGADDFVALMNTGKGHIENRESELAIAALQRAVRLRPASAPALRNLARAHLIPKRPENYVVAADLLKRALAINPESAATQYLMGLALNGVERYAEALPYFERAVSLDPHTATLRHQLADAYQKTGAHDKAREQLLETIRLEPTHTTAYYKLASHARRRGDREAVVRYTDEFRRLKEVLGVRPPDILDRCVHTDPEAAPIASSSAGTTPAIPVRWSDATPDAFASGGDRAATTAAVLEVDPRGVPTVVTASPDGTLATLKMTQGGIFARTVVAPAGSDTPGFTACAVGDFFLEITKKNKSLPKHDARNDVLLIGETGARLYEQTTTGTFDDRTPTSGLSKVGGRRAAWIDYDHNGVLDLFVAGENGLTLWQNNGYVIRFDSLETPVADAASRFENVTERVGITPTGLILDVAPLELENNGAIDVVAAGSGGSRVFVNQRAGRFAPMTEPPGPWPAALRVLTDDLDNDGHVDTLLISADHAVVLYGRSDRRHRFDFHDLSATGAALVDYDNDGWLDVVFFGDGLRVWRNGGNAGWRDATESTGADALDLPPIADAVAADYDNDGDTDLLLIGGDDALHLLRNDGGNANRQLKIRLVSILTNPTGIGNLIELRDGPFWVTRFVTRPVIEIGIGRSEQLDTVHSAWTNGVVDNEFLVVPATEPLIFTEKMVELGSCPFLFAWDGGRFRFVTDILGNAPLGLSLRRDLVLPADPDEIVYIGGETDLRPQQGRYILEVAECYREVLYLDAARLIVVDHPDEVEIHPTDKLMPPPFPESELWAITNVRAPIAVVSSDGVARWEALQVIDAEFAPAAEPLPPPFRGVCHELTLTLDFGPLDADAPLVLALTGWLRYGSASVNIALEQNPSVPVIWPALEVETEPGNWQSVDVMVGIPAGKTKTILCDLTGKLPKGAHRLRLTSSFEIRWDRIALGERTRLIADNVRELSPVSADLYHRGFPEMPAPAQRHPITPDYHALSQKPKWRTTPEGWCTRFGDVLELVARDDRKIAILNSGDAVTLRFDAVTAPPEEGLTRSFFFRSVGWEKDGDYNVVDGHTVDPLPVTDSDGDDWRLKYNTRWVPRQAFTESQPVASKSPGPPPAPP